MTDTNERGGAISSIIHSCWRRVELVEGLLGYPECFVLLLSLVLEHTEVSLSFQTRGDSARLDIKKRGLYFWG
jgi:hypothetical protein